MQNILRLGFKSRPSQWSAIQTLAPLARIHTASLTSWFIMVINLLGSLVPLLSCVKALPARSKGPALIPPRPSVPHTENLLDGLPVVSRNGTQLPDYTHVYYFNQLIDHTNPSLGTFKQRYYHTYEFYEPGA